MLFHEISICLLGTYYSTCSIKHLVYEVLGAHFQMRPFTWLEAVKMLILARLRHIIPSHSIVFSSVQYFNV